MKKVTRQLTHHERIRPIHYLGSKLRILDEIEEAVNEVEATGGRLFDLFSGSGTVSGFFRNKRDVTSVDIQEYSRVLCSALLRTKRHERTAADILGELGSSCFLHVLEDAFEPMLSLEEIAFEKARRGEYSDLFEIVRCGSLHLFHNDQASSENDALNNALGSTMSRIKGLGLDRSNKAVMSRYYAGPYFSFHQSIAVDAIIDYIHGNSEPGSVERDLLQAPLMGAVSEIVNTVGKQFAQPLKVVDGNGKMKGNLVSKILKDRSMPVLDIYGSWLKDYWSLKDTGRNHLVVREDYRGALSSVKEPPSVIYADPPYTRYHYSRYYHILETIAKNDVPSITTTFKNGAAISRGLYRDDRHQSPFCIQSQARAAFNDLFRTASKHPVPLILSYSPFMPEGKMIPRMQTIDQIVKAGKGYYADIEVRPAGDFSHSRLNKKSLNNIPDVGAELLIVCTKPFV